jgi:hypothetical protein
MQNFADREFSGITHVPIHSQAECIHIDRGRNYRQMPPHEKLVVGRKHSFVENFERSLEQRRALPQQDHFALLGKAD